MFGGEPRIRSVGKMNVKKNKNLLIPRPNGEELKGMKEIKYLGSTVSAVDEMGERKVRV